MGTVRSPNDGAGNRPGPGSTTPLGPAFAAAAAVLRRLGSGALRLAGLALIAGALVWWALATGLDPGDARTTVLILAAVLLLAPPAGLVLFALAVRALLALPDQLRQAPAAVRERTGEIGSRARAVAEAREHGLLRSAAALVRLWWSVASSREVVEVVAPAAILLTPWTVVAGVVGAGAAVVEVLAGFGALLWLAFTQS
jgi:hypothetical protein